MLLKKGNISLRAPEPEDVDFLFGIENDTSLWEVSRTLTPFSRFDLEQFIISADKDIYSIKQTRFIIQRNEEGKSNPVGAIDLFDFDPQNQRAGVGVVVLEKFRQQGVATAALEILVEYAFKHLKLHQLYCNIDAHNATSLELFRKRGFKESGVKLDWNRSDKGWTNEIILQLIIS